MRNRFVTVERGRGARVGGALLIVVDVRVLARPGPLAAGWWLFVTAVLLAPGRPDATGWTLPIPALDKLAHGTLFLILVPLVWRWLARTEGGRPLAGALLAAFSGAGAWGALLEWLQRWVPGPPIRASATRSPT